MKRLVCHRCMIAKPRTSRYYRNIEKQKERTCRECELIEILAFEEAKYYQENPNEVWKDVIGYEGYYKVSSIGRVRSIPREVASKNNRVYRFKGNILKKHAHKIKGMPSGYEVVHLTIGGKTHVHLVHRLVASAFLGDLGKYMVVNHINEIRDDNRLSNLEWVTVKTNVTYRQSEYSKKYIKKAIADLVEKSGTRKFIKYVDEIINCQL